MPTETHKGYYQAIQHGERDGEPDSKTSIMGNPPSRSPDLRSTSLKIALIFLLAVFSFLSGFVTGARRREYQESSNTFMPTIPFVGGPVYFSENKTWSTPGPVSDALWAEERETTRSDRFVKIDDPAKYGVPYGSRDKAGVQFYSISAFHQLHCLAMFRAIVYNTTSSTGTETGDAEGWGHLGHCFNYVRDAIRCHADSAMEWPDVVTLPDGGKLFQPKTPLLGLQTFRCTGEVCGGEQVGRA
ncbi:hypothetical protein EG328_003313 [Venturia inaequalis]|uniref:Oxidase ustYa n=1 Tax=Venturia inaequalis TaxID=5025 RepID=A0A8H3VFB7_VENIN|nr:hypothetical protein EG328_003313 [Venturia inaequalis]